MAEAPGIPGQIMHSPTVEKIIQPAEAKGDVAAQQAVAESDRAAEIQRRSVGQVRESEGGRVEEDQSGEKRERESRHGKKKKPDPDRAEVEKRTDGQGRHIDLMI